MKAWVARDKDGLKVFYPSKPYLRESIGCELWCDVAGWPHLILNRTEFPEVTFENSPQEVEIRLKK